MKTNRARARVLASGLLCLGLSIALSAGAMVETKAPVAKKVPPKKKISIQTKSYLSVNHILAAGSASDYRAGNQYPLASAHQQGGLGLAFSIGEAWSLGLETHLQFLGRYTLTDPKENDSIRIGSRFQLKAMLVFGIRLLGKKGATLHIQFGGGGAWLPSKESETTTSTHDNEVSVTYPSRWAFASFAGLETAFPIGSRMKFLLSPRFSLVTLTPRQSEISLLLGLQF